MQRYWLRSAPSFLPRRHWQNGTTAGHRRSPMPLSRQTTCPSSCSATGSGSLQLGMIVRRTSSANRAYPFGLCQTDRQRLGLSRRERPTRQSVSLTITRWRSSSPDAADYAFVLDQIAANAVLNLAMIDQDVTYGIFGLEGSAAAIRSLRAECRKLDQSATPWRHQKVWSIVAAAGSSGKSST